MKNYFVFAGWHLYSEKGIVAMEKEKKKAHKKALELSKLCDWAQIAELDTETLEHRIIQGDEESQ